MVLILKDGTEQPFEDCQSDEDYDVRKVNVGLVNSTIKAASGPSVMMVPISDAVGIMPSTAIGTIPSNVGTFPSTVGTILFAAVCTILSTTA